MTPLAELPHHVTGAGDPVTLFAAGLGGSLPDTRPLGSGVRGRRVFVETRADTYAGLASELLATAGVVGARRAVGVSLGAGGLLRILADQPGRFDRVVLFLPAALNRPPTPAAFNRLTQLANARAATELADLVVQELPDRPEALRWAQQTALRLWADPRRRAPLSAPPVPDVSVLRRVSAPVMVIGQSGDDLHPAAVARHIAAALPAAVVHIFDAPGAMWLHRTELRRLVSGFLNA